VLSFGIWLGAKEESMGANWHFRMFGPALVLAILALSLSASGQITFERAYGTADFDEGLCVQQTSDGGYVISAWGGLTLMKTDSLGDSLWAEKLGSDSCITYGESVRQTLDEGYVVAGSIKPNSPGGRNDVYLVKTDSMGKTLWSRAYGGAGQDGAYSAQQTLGGGYILAGVTRSFVDPTGDVYLIKTDSLGDTLWTRTYGGSLDDCGFSVQQTSDCGYIIAGYANYVAPPDRSGDVYLIKTDSSGNTQWTRTFGGPYWDVGNSVQQTSDEGYVIAGTAYRDFSGSSSGDVLLIKTNALGDSLWSKLYSVGSDVNRGSCVRQTYDGGYIITGDRYVDGPGYHDVFLIRTDSFGDTLWTRTFGGWGSEFGNSVWVTTDSGFVVAGRTYTYGLHLQDVYLIKTNDQGLIVPRRNVGVVSIDSPGDTVFTDSMYSVTATLKNWGNVLDTFYVVAATDGYADTVKVNFLDPGSSYQVHFGSWHVPSTDSVIYTMTVCTHIVDDVDTTNDCKQKAVFAYNPTGVGEELSHKPLTGIFGLSQNEPNPFHRSTVISYSLPTACHVTLKVCDTSGRLVETLVDQNQEAGAYQLRWRAENHASSIYFCRLDAEGRSSIRKMILLR
jgi:hypothetical protein